MKDFEMAVINSVQTSFPGATHNGCQFHFCECLQRNIKANDLAAKIVRVLFFLIEDLTKSNEKFLPNRSKKTKTFKSGSNYSPQFNSFLLRDF